ncbi:MAG: hypothetical protein AB1403_13160 [Candidatus Riflebacteria bacterium]
MKSKQVRRLKLVTLVAMLAAALGSVGCRQAPSNPPRFYEKELQEMERQAALKEQQKGEKFLEDRYPWEGRVSKTQSLPCRIAEKEKTLNYEIDYLHTFVRGRPRTKPRLRD